MTYNAKKKEPILSPFDANGFENWYQPLPPNIQTELEIFLVDFKTQIYQEEVEDEAKYSDFEDEYEEENPGQNRVKKISDVSGLILYYLAYDSNKKEYYKGKTFIKQKPYFYLMIEDQANSNSIIQNINDKYSNRIENIELITAYDAGDLLFLKEKRFIKIEVSVPNLVSALRERMNFDGVIEWREADIQYHHRVAIDYNINVGKWYNAIIEDQFVVKITESNRKDLPPLKLVAYDIETNTNKKKEPNPDIDIITMVSLYGGTDSPTDNIVIVNKEVIDCQEVSDFHILLREKDDQNNIPWIDWYKTSELHDLENDGSILNKLPMTVKIVENEKELIVEFLKYLQNIKPDILTDFYGDKFDLPFFKVRADKSDIDFEKITGFAFKKKLGKKFITNWLQDVESVASHGMFHLDAFLWNLRYSYLPKKDLGLKSSVARKLKFTPIGREALWQLGKEDSNPAEGVAYAGSDGYVTWRYVKDIILDFAMSMGRMFPVNTSEILTKTAGALDDLLVDCIGHHRNIIAKQRFKQKGLGYFNNKINIQGITYTGGFVEAPNPGIWRKDLKYDISVGKNAYIDLKNVLDKNLDSIEQKILIDVKKSYFDTKIRDLFENEEVYFAYVDNSSFDNCLEKASSIIKAIKSNSGIILEEEYKKADSLILLNTEKKKEELFISIDNILDDSDQKSVKGLHLDVTSMYPSQIRQYKLQPSGIVNAETCLDCKHREEKIEDSRPICAFESPWTAKIATNKPCISKIRDQKSPNGYCERFQKACEHLYAEESNCNDYDAGAEKKFATEEFYKLDQNKNILVFSFVNGEFKEKLLKYSYLARGFRTDQINSKFVLNYLETWIQDSIKGAIINFKGDYPFKIESSGRNPILWNGFLYIDVKQKNSSFLISLESRFCQKAYDYMSSIMDMFFQERVNHKSEAKRLSAIIKKKKKKNELIAEDLIQRQKYHDSTQLGLKVPLNSIYGLLGMKGGVHNASLPSAGVTTSLSARLIQWSAEILSEFGPITELDTDGVWFFVPESLQTHFKTEIGFDSENIVENRNIPILEEYLNLKVNQEKGNYNYWTNNGKNIIHSPKSLLSFEQDGPYDFQYVQGKKKYIVYNRKSDGNWEEEELIGLETKRADFSKLHKELQETIISTFLEDWNKTTLRKLYQKAADKVDEFILKIKNEELDENYFILPKTIKKLPEEYFIKGPEVIAAYMLKDLGFTVEPGMSIDYFLIKPIKDPKNNIELKVAPQQLFKASFKEVKRFLKKRKIAKLEFQLGQINNMDDVLKHILRIDYDSYIESLIGPGKISDRMIYTIAKKQGITLNKGSKKSDFQLENIIENTSILEITDKSILTISKEKDLTHNKETSKINLIKSKQPKNTSWLNFKGSNNSINLEKDPIINKIIKSNNNNHNGIREEVKRKENKLLNNFLNLEIYKNNEIVQNNNVRLKKMLPALERFYSPTEKEVYRCEICNINLSVVRTFSCPKCSNSLILNI